MDSFECKQCGESFDAKASYEKHMAAPHAAAASQELRPADLEKAIAHIEFPKSKTELVAFATKQETMEDTIVRALEGLPDRTYKSASEVVQAFGGATTKKPPPAKKAADDRKGAAPTSSSR